MVAPERTVPVGLVRVRWRLDPAFAVNSRGGKALICRKFGVLEWMSDAIFPAPKPMLSGPK
jgi:hypothetical protein